MKQILVDMDGVLADVYTQFRTFEKRETGREFQPGELTGKLELDAFPNGAKHVRSKGFFRTVPCMENSVEGLRYLNDKYRILIVSSATEFPDSLKEKQEWLNEFYPFIGWQQMIFCGKKDAIKGDIMIDDHPKNLDYFEGQRILFTQPHNELTNNSSYTRVKTWKEIMEIL